MGQAGRGAEGEGGREREIERQRERERERERILSSLHAWTQALSHDPGIPT